MSLCPLLAVKRGRMGMRTATTKASLTAAPSTRKDVYKIASPGGNDRGYLSPELTA